MSDDENMVAECFRCD